MRSFGTKIKICTHLLNVALLYDANLIRARHQSYLSLHCKAVCNGDDNVDRNDYN